MKRSEMLSLMYGKLCKEHIVNGESLYVSIERLLDFMEEQGMQPPAYEIYEELPAKYMNEVAYRKTKVNKWEPEGKE